MITYTQDGNVCSCTLMSSVPEGLTGYEVTPPQDKEFRNAWVINSGNLEYDMVKAKDIAHDKRRAKRNKEFEVHDKTISIHGLFNKPLADEAEAKRIIIREIDDKLQQKISNCRSIETLKDIINKENL